MANSREGTTGSDDRDGVVGKSLRGVDAAADRAAGAVSEGADRAREKFDRAMDGVKRGAERSRDGVHAATDRVEDALDSARERVSSARERLDEVRAKTLEDVIGDVNGLVRENPGTALLVAGAFGFFLGSLLSRGRD